MNLLQRLRIERGLSLTALSELSGVDRMAINKIERGMSRPHRITLAKLARAFNLPIEDLLPLEVQDTGTRAPLQVARERGQ